MCGTDTDCGCTAPANPIGDLIMRYLKPFSTLAVGMVLGYLVGPKIVAKVRP